MTEWRIVPNSNVEVSNDGRVRRDGVEFVPYIDKKGYRVVRVGERMIKLHRLIAAAFIPNPLGKPCVDHISGDKLDNCVESLQWATYCENSRNCGPRAKKSELPRGVRKFSKRYGAQIIYECKHYHLGTYDTPEEASEIYEVTAEELFGKFYRKPE